MFRDDPETLALVAGLSWNRRAYRYRGPDIAEPTVEEVEALTARSWPVHGPLTPSALPAGPVYEEGDGVWSRWPWHLVPPPPPSRPTSPPAPILTVPPIPREMQCRLRYEDGTIVDVPVDAEGNFVNPYTGILWSVTLLV